MTRREFMKKSLSGSSVLALPPLLNGCLSPEFFQKHLKKINKKDLDRIIKRKEKKYSQKFSKKATINSTQAIEETSFAFTLDLSKCIGCRKCVDACIAENNQSREPKISWIDLLEMEKGSHNLTEGNRYYHREKVPAEGHYYLPVQCQHCQEPPCVKVCPVKATWKEPDGIVVIDYNWCISCRYCVAACPYGARKVNWSAPRLPAKGMNPQMHYLGNVPREKGEIEKCTFCIQRVREGKYPACVEACPTGARKFGNLMDEKSVIRKIMANKNIFVLKAELNTLPRFYYFFG